MSKGQHRLRYREGVCPEFGRVRPIHLAEFISMESRQQVDQASVECLTRLGWSGATPLPKVGDYVSVHQKGGKFLAIVAKVVQSCVCCAARAMWFVYLASVQGVLRQDTVCECASSREWLEASDWLPSPDSGKCKRVGSGTLLQISHAIKQKFANKP